MPQLEKMRFKMQKIGILCLILTVLLAGCSKSVFYKIPKSYGFDELNGLGVRLIEISTTNQKGDGQDLKMTLEVRNFNNQTTEVAIKDIVLLEKDGTRYDTKNAEHYHKTKINTKENQTFQFSFSIPRKVADSFYIISLKINETNFFYPKEDATRFIGEDKYESAVYSLLTLMGVDVAYIYSQQELMQEMKQLSLDISKQNPNSEHRCTNYNQLKIRLQRVIPFLPNDHKKIALQVNEKFQGMLNKAKCIETWRENEGQCSKDCNFIDCSRVANLSISSGDLKSGTYYFNKAEQCYMNKNNLESYDFEHFKTIAFPNDESKNKYKTTSQSSDCNTLEECKLVARIFSVDTVEFSKSFKVMTILKKACLMKDNQNDYDPCFLAGSYFRSSDNQQAKTLLDKAFKIRNDLCEKNDIESCYQVGLALDQGSYGMRKEPAKAQKYFRIACDANHTLACKQI